MNQDNLNKLVESKKELKEILANFEKFHSGDESFSEPVQKQETEFSRWYFNEGTVFNEFSSYKFLEGFYDKTYELYSLYFEIKASPVKKSLFSDGVSKRKSVLDETFLDANMAAKRLFSAIDIFVHNVERSKIIEKATGEVQAKETKTDIPPVVSEIKLEETNEVIDSNAVSSLESEKVNEVVGETSLPKKIVVEEESFEEEDEKVDIQETIVEEISKEVENDDVNEEVQEEVENIATTEEPQIVTEEVETDTIEVVEEEKVNEEESEQQNVEEAKLEVEQQDVDSNEEEPEDELEKLKKMLQDDFESKLKSLGGQE